ncbi:hypothetical protein Q0N88_07210 [Bacillus thuringiensis]|uniref:hypothetical protein n=1 Tax=Bacillus thuringiensis TaxID=1428 RepID=UPI00345A8F85
MKKLSVNQSVVPITLDGKMVVQEGVLQSIQMYMKKSLSKQVSTERTLKKSTKELTQMKMTLSSFDERLTKMQQSNVAKKVIRDQLQMERHRKAKQFVHENVQLSIEEIIGTKDEIEKRLAERMKRETTRVMCLITFYVKKRLGLRSIEDIPNGLVEAHKTLVRDLTWKKLKNSEMKGAV